MTSALFASAWAALILAGAWWWRPAGVGHQRRHAPSTKRTVSWHRPRGLAVRWGEMVLRALQRPDGNAETTGRIGLAMAVGLVTLVVMAPVAPAAMLATWWWQASARRRRLRHRQLLLVRHLPEVVDLLVLAVGAGLTVHASVRAVAERAHGPPAEELATVVEQVRLGRRLAEALEEVPIRAGEALRPLMSALIASERYGAPLGENLARLAEDVRADRRRNAEEMARKVPVKLLFPLVFCTLPAFGLLTVAPLIAGALEGLRP